MVGFFVPLFLAALLVVIFRPVHEWVVLRIGGKPRVASLVTTITILLVVLLPAVMVMGVAAAQGTSMVSRLNYNNLAFAIQRTRVQLGLEIKNIAPFVRMPELIQSMGEIEVLADDRQTRTAKDKVREFDQLLRTLEVDFTPLTELQRKSLDESRIVLAELERDMDLLAADSLDNKTANSGNSITGDGKQASPSDNAKESPSESIGESPSESIGESPSESIGEDTSTGDAANAAEVTSEQSPASEIDYRSPAERYHRTLVRLDSKSSAFTSELLGGDIRAQLKMFANPTDDKINTLIDQLQTYLQPRIVTLTSATGEFLLQTAIGLSILIIALYFFLVDGPAMVRTLMRLSPLDDRYEHKLLIEFDRTSRAVVLATVLSALAQGILAASGYYFCGLGSIVLLFFLTSFMALIPFFGAASVWAPCVIWLGFVEERWGAAIGLALYGAVIVSSVDNVIKVFVLHGRSQLHPLLALLSVLGGVQVFGPIGILVGPMVVVFLQTTLEILNHELTHYESPTEGELEGLALATGAGDVVGTLQNVESEKVLDKEKAGEALTDNTQEAAMPAKSDPPARAKSKKKN